MADLPVLTTLEDATAWCAQAAERLKTLAPTTAAMLLAMSKAPTKHAMFCAHRDAPELAKNETDGGLYWNVLGYLDQGLNPRTPKPLQGAAVKKFPALAAILAYARLHPNLTITETEVSVDDVKIPAHRFVLKAAGPNSPDDPLGQLKAITGVTDDPTDPDEGVLLYVDPAHPDMLSWLANDVGDTLCYLEDSAKQAVEDFRGFWDPAQLDTFPPPPN